MNLSRIETLRSHLERFGFQGAVAIPGPTLRYLTGHEFHLMERPVFLIVTIDEDPIIVLPELESARVDDAGGRIQIFSYAEDDASRSAALKNALNLVGTSARSVAVEPLSMRYFELNLLQSIAPDWDLQSGTELFTALRAKKDQAEIKHIRKAVEIAETALQETLPLIKVGMSEHDLAAELVIQLLRANSETALPFQPIVASGPNSALPHATPTDRLLTPGDLLILDWGARSGGYISDITRTFAIGKVEPEFKRIHQVVLEANTAGRSAVRPRAHCDAIDRITRQVILDADYGERFIHRTGHGIGLEAHEPPNIRSGELVPLEAGMTFTVEPGIYLPGRAGVRIEDNVVVTENGVETLTTLERKLEVVA